MLTASITTVASSASWFELGELVYAEARQREDLADNLLQPVRGDECGRAPRPKDVRLECDKLLQNFGIKRLLADTNDPMY